MKFLNILKNVLAGIGVIGFFSFLLTVGAIEKGSLGEKEILWVVVSLAMFGCGLLAIDVANEIEYRERNKRWRKTLVNTAGQEQIALMFAITAEKKSQYWKGFNNSLAVVNKARIWVERSDEDASSINCRNYMRNFSCYLLLKQKVNLNLIQNADRWRISIKFIKWIFRKDL